MARRTTKTASAAYQMPRLQITADALPGVIMFGFACLTDGSLDPEIMAHQALAEFKIDGCEWGLRAALQECCFPDWEIDEVIATGVLPGVGLGWTAAMAADASLAVADASDVHVVASLSVVASLAAAASLSTAAPTPALIAA
jgi:hypothetical protein